MPHRAFFRAICVGSIAIFLGVLVHPTAALCFATNQSGVLLPVVLNASGVIDCLDGFVCPNLDPLNTSTYPAFCPPSSDCAAKRAVGDRCDPQGLFEPQLVPSGFFSRDRRTIERCPAGHICPMGSREPIKCPALTVCTEGSHRKYHYGLVIFYCIGVGILLAVVAIYRRVFAKSTLASAVDGQFSISSSTTPNDTATSSMGSDDGSPHCRSRKVQLLCDGFKRRRGGTKPLCFEFHNLRVSVPLTGGKTKHLLNNISGHFSPGKVTAILGPSGSGKTTLMSTLLGKLAPNVARSGNLTINGDSHISKYRHSIGFVPQDDVLHCELSAFKNLYYSSEIRLPRDWSAIERALFRSAVIDILGLIASRDVPIGDEVNRGISGGQRKRASIGLELVAAPLAILLDEPTSGLDSFAAMELCLLLREIALQTKLCVAMVIHQPRVEIWNALDEVLILAPGGYTVYQGSQQDAQGYFENHCGIKFPTESNPADVIMDAVTARARELVEKWCVVSGEAPGSPERASTAAREPMEADDIPWPGASLLRQVLLSHNRAVEKQLMIMQAFIVELFVATLCGIILGQSVSDFEHITQYRDPYKPFSVQPFDALLPQMNLYAIMSLSLAGATAGVRVLSEPMRNYYRETAAGHSRLAFFIGSILAAVYRIVLCAYSFAAFYFLIPGFAFPFGAFFVVYLGTYWCMYAMAAPIAVLAAPRNASLIAALGGIVAGITSGFVGFPLWIKRLSFGFYSAQALHQMYDDVIKVAFDPSHEQWGYERLSVGATSAINFSWGIIVFAFAFVLLINVNRERQR